MSTRKIGNPNLILDRLRDAYNIDSDAELARFLTVNASTVATWRKNSSMKFDRILENAGDINMNWLFYGEEPKWKNDLRIRSRKTDLVTEPEVPYFKSIRPDTFEGNQPETTDEHIQISLPSTFIYKELETAPSELFLTRAAGDTMQPTINDRDFILVEKKATRPFAGRIYLVRMDDSLLCKRIHEYPGRKLLLMNDNSRYKHFEIQPDQPAFAIIGRVVWHGRII